MKPDYAKVILYFNSLHGVGHYVRTCRIADALASFADVLLINGGRQINHLPPPNRAKMISLPGVFRDPRDLVVRSENPRYSLCEVFESRRKILIRLVKDEPVQALILEYFPFQRWEFVEEIFCLINTIKLSNSRARIISSVRDFPKPAANVYEHERIVEVLNNHFDAILVHGDVDICGNSRAFACLNGNTPPLTYTGYIASEVLMKDTNILNQQRIQALYGNVVLSYGGGVDSLEVLVTCIEAWHRLEESGQRHGRLLVVFLGAFLKDTDKREVLAAAMDSPYIKVLEFSPWFSQVLANADLSISCAGYNTCVEVIRSKVKAIFIPSTLVSDQTERANRLASLGIGRVLPREHLSVSNVRSAIVDSDYQETPPTSLSLDGLNFTVKIVRALIAQ